MGTADPRPTIVFLHGTRLTGASWAAQAEDLADEFHVLAPDLPGHGSAADVPFTIDAAAARVADLIATDAHEGRAVVVGLSLGGYVAMAVAAGWPERVRGLAILGRDGRARREPGPLLPGPGDGLPDRPRRASRRR
jgi:pimeloyl-ACP methyl ester carboxylesterase